LSEILRGWKKENYFGNTTMGLRPRSLHGQSSTKEASAEKRGKVVNAFRIAK